MFALFCTAPAIRLRCAFWLFILLGISTSASPLLDQQLAKAIDEKRPFNDIKTLLDKGADPNAMIDHQRILGYAVKQGSPNLVELLLKSGADVHAKDAGNLGHTALLHATDSWHSNEAVLRLLLNAGANVNEQNKEGKTPLIYAARARDSTAVTLLLQANAKVNIQDSDGESALHSAAYADDENALRQIEALLKAGADANLQNNKGETALMRQSQYGETASIRELLTHGANINTQDHDGTTALMFLMRNRSIDLEKLQLFAAHGANFTSKDKEGRSVLAAFVSQNRHSKQMDLLHFLLKHGAKADGKALLAAISHYNYDLASDLLTKLTPAELNAQNENGQTALLLAAQKSEFDLALRLNDKGATLNQRDKNGNTALFWALHYGRPKDMQRFIERGADIHAKGLSNGLEILLKAAQVGDIALAQALLSKKIDLNATGREEQSETDPSFELTQKTALMVALEAGKYEFADFLLAHGADINARVAQQKTALMLAAEEENAKNQQWLINKGADTTLRDSSNRTIEMIAHATQKEREEKEARAEKRAKRQKFIRTASMAGFFVLLALGFWGAMQIQRIRYALCLLLPGLFLSAHALYSFLWMVAYARAELGGLWLVFLGYIALWVKSFYLKTDKHRYALMYVLAYLPFATMWIYSS